MSIYVCRWPNGDFSVVDAASRKDAIVRLDEVGNAELADLFRFREFMVHFQLREKVENLDEPVAVELEGFGEEMKEFLSTHVYPVYSKALFEVVENLPDDVTISDPENQQALSKITDALETERQRRSGTKKADLSDNPLIRCCQEVADMPKVLAKRLVNTP